MKLTQVTLSDPGAIFTDHKGSSHSGRGPFFVNEDTQVVKNAIKAKLIRRTGVTQEVKSKPSGSQKQFPVVKNQNKDADN